MDGPLDGFLRPVVRGGRIDKLGWVRFRAGLVGADGIIGKHRGEILTGHGLIGLEGAVGIVVHGDGRGGPGAVIRELLVGEVVIIGRQSLVAIADDFDLRGVEAGRAIEVDGESRGAVAGLGLAALDVLDIDVAVAELGAVEVEVGVLAVAL